MKNLIFTLALVCLLASACAPAGTNTHPAAPAVIEANPAPQAWIDAPLTGSTLPLAEVEIISHAASLAGIAQVELSVNGTVIRTDPNPNHSQTFNMVRQNWLPTSGGVYQVSVRAQNTNGAWSAPASISITVQDASPTPSAPPSETPTATPSQTPTPNLPLTIILTRNSFCRAGPGEAYREITAIPAGDSVEVRAQSADARWLFVFWQKFNVECWIVTAAAPTDANFANIPVRAAPPTPIPTSAPTNAPTSLPLPSATPTTYKP
jgi:hypothetical protein